MTRKLRQALIEQKQSTEQVNQKIPGLLGIPLDGQRRVEVPGRNAFVYVRLRNNTSEVIQAYNNKVAIAYNLPVLVHRVGGRYEVFGVDTERYDNNWSSFAPFLPRHGNTHSLPDDLSTGGGGDIVWVYPRQIMPALVFPSGSLGAPNVLIAPYTIKKNDGSWMYVGNTGTPSFLPYRPVTGTQAVMALVYLDSVSGNPQIIVGSGTYFSNTLTGTSQIVPYIPSLTNPSHIPLAAIRLITGTNRIGWDNIYDARQWIHVTPTGSVGGGFTWNIQDEGVPLGNATTLNVVGANADVSISGSVARLFITGSVGGGGGGVDQVGVFVQDEGVPLVTGTVFNFVGAGVDASISGSVARVHISGSSLLDGPQGFGYNYLLRTVTDGASGTFTTSLKAISNVDPSPSNPVILRIGETRRHVMSALNVVLTSGTNWMNCGGPELTTQNVDLFVYAIWESNQSAVRIGVSRIPNARTMGDFVNTSTDERYIKGNYSSFNSDDEVEVIGRVRTSKSGTLGAWGSSGGSVFSRPMKETDWLYWTPNITGGFSANPTLICRYKLIDNLLHLSQDTTAVGTSNSTGFTETIPFRAVNIASYFQYSAMPYVRNNGTLEAAGVVFASPASNILTLNRSAFAAWTASGNKTAAFNIAIEI